MHAQSFYANQITSPKSRRALPLKSGFENPARTCHVCLLHYTSSTERSLSLSKMLKKLNPANLFKSKPKHHSVTNFDQEAFGGRPARPKAEEKQTAVVQHHVRPLPTPPPLSPPSLYPEYIQPHLKPPEEKNVPRPLPRPPV